MRPNTLRPQRWIAGVLLSGVGLLSGCYSPWMHPGYRGNGYGNPYYGNGGYGGYGSGGIQTLTPGNYYTPGTSNPGTYAPPNGIQPQPDPSNSKDSGSGTGGAAGDGGDAPPAGGNYNPPATGDTPSRLVPDPSPFYPPTPGNVDPPESGAPEREINSGTGGPAAMLEPTTREDWTTHQPIERASGLVELPAESPAATDATGTTETAAESVETPAAAEEEAPPLLKP